MRFQQLLPLVFVVLLASLAIKLNAPPDVIGKSGSDSVFSATRAYEFLKEVSRAPHSTGSAESMRVRQYLLKRCSDMGLAAQVQHTTSISASGTSVLAANVHNVIATLKGQQNGKSLLVMAHYDSQPNTPGAGDDGAGVAAMLETIRILTSTRRTFQNDIIFLFTDGEEWGLCGATGFAQDSTWLGKVGFVLNFEGRGNSGVSSMFEVNPENGWAVKQYMQAGAYPVGSSLGYEIYKNLPNDTDYTVFRRAGIAGLNNAFIDGFVNYHSPNDKPENLDLRSLQHHGSNLLSLVKHLANASLDHTKSPDISFFNIMGYWMVWYPASWNLPLTVFCDFLFIVLLVAGMQRKRIAVKGLLAGFFVLVLVLALMSASTYFLIRGIHSVYPLYERFYAANSYNSQAYFLAFTALGVGIFSTIFQWLNRRIAGRALVAGSLLLEIILLNLLYAAMPTAIYMLLFPLLFTLFGNIILINRPWRESGRDWAGLTITLVSLLPSIVLFPPIIDQVYIVFGLTPMTAGVVLVVGLWLGLLLPVLLPAFEVNPLLIPGLALVAFVAFLVVGHATSGYDEAHPLQSSVYYLYRSDDSKAFWVSGFHYTDEWNKQFFPDGRVEGGRLMSDAPLLPLTSPAAVVTGDTVVNNIRKLRLHCTSTRNATSITIELSSQTNAGGVLVHGPAGGSARAGVSRVYYVGLDSLGFDVTFETAPGKPLEFTMLDRSLGLPELKGIQPPPAWIVPGVGPQANTIQVMKKFVF